MPDDDLPARLRAAIPHHRTLTLDDVYRHAHRRRLTTAVTVAVVALVAALAISAPVVLNQRHHRQVVRVGGLTPTGTGTTRAVSSTASRGGVTTTLTIDNPTVTISQAVYGRISISNNSGHALVSCASHGDACASSPYLSFSGPSGGTTLPTSARCLSDNGCGLQGTTSEDYPPSPVGYPPLPKGTTVLGVTIYTGEPPGKGNLPVAGVYQVTATTESYPDVPEPRPIALTLLPLGSSSPPAVSTSTTRTGRTTTTTRATPSTTRTSSPPAATGHVTVPALEGLNQQPAEQALVMLSLGFETVPVRSTTVPNGAVIAESPAPGSTVPDFTRISLYISSGPNGPTDGTPPQAGQPTTTVTIPVSSTTPPS